MTKWDKGDFKKFIKIFLILFISCICFFGLNGCVKSDKALISECRSSRVNNNIRIDADNFKIRRRVIALNARTGDALFTVEGYISIKDNSDGDLNVTIKTGEDSYKLFYAHLSDDVTYTSVQLDDVKENPYAYKITFFPTKEFIKNGLVDMESTD